MLKKYNTLDINNKDERKAAAVALFKEVLEFNDVDIEVCENYSKEKVFELSLFTCQGRDNE